MVWSYLFGYGYYAGYDSSVNTLYYQLAIFISMVAVLLVAARRVLNRNDDDGDGAYKSDSEVAVNRFSYCKRISVAEYEEEKVSYTQMMVE